MRTRGHTALRNDGYEVTPEVTRAVPSTVYIDHAHEALGICALHHVSASEAL